MVRSFLTCLLTKSETNRMENNQVITHICAFSCVERGTKIVLIRRCRGKWITTDWLSTRCKSRTVTLEYGGNRGNLEMLWTVKQTKGNQCHKIKVKHPSRSQRKWHWKIVHILREVDGTTEILKSFRWMRTCECIWEKIWDENCVNEWIRTLWSCMGTLQDADL